MPSLFFRTTEGMFEKTCLHSSVIEHLPCKQRVGGLNPSAGFGEKMPAKNKPKRLDRARSWRVARRKKRRTLLIKGKSRSRPKRPKNKAEKKE